MELSQPVFAAELRADPRTEHRAPQSRYIDVMID
jgi:hypothetical protein